MPESHYERRQREAAQRMLKAAMPDLKRMMADIANQQQFMTGIGQVYSSRYDDMLKSITQNLVPTVEIPQYPADTGPPTRPIRLDHQECARCRVISTTAKLARQRRQRPP